MHHSKSDVASCSSSGKVPEGRLLLVYSSKLELGSCTMQHLLLAVPG